MSTPSFPYSYYRYSNIPTSYDEFRFHSFEAWRRKHYDRKLYKIALDIGCSCPNRDGSIGTRGCLFCSEGGSGEFANGQKKEASTLSEKIEAGIKLLGDKQTGLYIAYFQSFTNTYGDPVRLGKLYEEALSNEQIAGISIATRPDCISDEILSLLSMLKDRYPDKFIWTELGLQTIHEETASLIRRGYRLTVFEKALEDLNKIGIPVIVHLILGLPGESKEQILESVRYLNTKKVWGVKLQLLHILEGTDLADLYRKGECPVLTEDEYVDFVIDSLENLSPHIVVHRITGDGADDLLIAPTWSRRKRAVLNHIASEMKKRDSYQGKALSYPTFLWGTMEFDEEPANQSIRNQTTNLAKQIEEALPNSYFTLIGYTCGDWDGDFSPWKATDLLPERSFAGNGQALLSAICESLLPTAPGPLYLVGYSLAGLFSLWAFYERKTFTGCACVSGSLWYPDWENYVKNHSPLDAPASSKAVYLSLGGKEPMALDPLLASIGEKTKWQDLMLDQDPAIGCHIFDWNKGGHFADSAKRLAKGIAYLLTHPT